MRRLLLLVLLACPLWGQYAVHAVNGCSTNTTTNCTLAVSSGDLIVGFFTEGFNVAGNGTISDPTHGAYPLVASVVGNRGQAFGIRAVCSVTTATLTITATVPIGSDVQVLGIASFTPTTGTCSATANTTGTDTTTNNVTLTTTVPNTLLVAVADGSTVLTVGSGFTQVFAFTGSVRHLSEYKAASNSSGANNVAVNTTGGTSRGIAAAAFAPAGATSSSSRARRRLIQ